VSHGNYSLLEEQDGQTIILLNKDFHRNARVAQDILVITASGSGKIISFLESEQPQMVYLPSKSLANLYHALRFYRHLLDIEGDFDE